MFLELENKIKINNILTFIIVGFLLIFTSGIVNTIKNPTLINILLFFIFFIVSLTGTIVMIKIYNYFKDFAMSSSDN